MKRLCFLFAFAAFGASAQNVLFIDDNDNITDNSDTMVATLVLTDYADFDYWNVADSSATPGSDFLEEYDVVIWYASTDGFELGFWNAGEEGDSELLTYVTGGGRLWVVGADILYAQYASVGTAFEAGDFVYDYMGLESYDSQSYGNDGNLGVAELDKVSGMPGYLPSDLAWIFPTAWWVDAVTPLGSSSVMYEMGPAGYTLAGGISMTHYRTSTTNVMSSFFDPALIDTRPHRIEFLEKSIFYLLQDPALGIAETSTAPFSVYPNPAKEQLCLSVSEQYDGQQWELFSAEGVSVSKGILENGKASLAISSLAPGMYFVKIAGLEGAAKVVKE